MTGQSKVVLKNLFCRILLFIVAVSISLASDLVNVTWHGPYHSGGGYWSEAVSVMDALEKVGYKGFGVAHHGDSVNEKHLVTQSSEDLAKIDKYSTENLAGPDRPYKPIKINVCHSEPGAWCTPIPKYFTTQCPPIPTGNLSVQEYNIGRTMFETDKIPKGWKNRLNYMDEVWVPTEKQRQIFINNGAAKEKVFVLGEGVDTDFYKPKSWRSLPKERLSQLGLGALNAIKTDKTTVYLFVGKFENRKGMEWILEAYFKAYRNTDDVILLIVTSDYHDGIEFDVRVKKILKAKKLYNTRLENEIPKYKILTGVHQEGMPYLYSAAHALVQPSHGEGWGRPHMEAMACGTPVVATNWGGPLEFIYDDFSPLVRKSKAKKGKKGDKASKKKSAKAEAGEKEVNQKKKTSKKKTQDEEDNEETESPKKADKKKQEEKSVKKESATEVEEAEVDEETSPNKGRNGFLIQIEKELVPADNWKGHKWAKPKLSHLTEIIKYIHKNRKEAASVGRRARRDIVAKFSLEALGQQLTAHFARIEKALKPHIIWTVPQAQEEKKKPVHEEEPDDEDGKEVDTGYHELEEGEGNEEDEEGQGEEYADEDEEEEEDQEL